MLICNSTKRELYKNKNIHLLQYKCTSILQKIIRMNPNSYANGDGHFSEHMVDRNEDYRLRFLFRSKSPSLTLEYVKYIQIYSFQYFIFQKNLFTHLNTKYMLLIKNRNNSTTPLWIRTQFKAISSVHWLSFRWFIYLKTRHSPGRQHAKYCAWQIRHLYSCTSECISFIQIWWILHQ